MLQEVLGITVVQYIEPVCLARGLHLSYYLLGTYCTVFR